VERFYKYKEKADVNLALDDDELPMVATKGGLKRTLGQLFNFSVEFLTPTFEKRAFKLARTAEC
jgi:hypothetical protein